ncbi:alpha-ketoglutarate-dependent dioxygenase alkB [Syzygium oleosum]|uniref:alpha-ketoglutarate-dependent dioxygenase alkB n=1 Tax=Syzygium oleosum TaxID=219896 RepID=UPI0011D2C4BA|nr:alpha-ketoglutarate-dependent dioxygenase alkB [Syzygium oleosum]
MYGAEKPPGGESERTAFRQAEKKYKLYYDDGPLKSSRKKKRAKPVDVSDVIDFEAISEAHERGGELPVGVAVVRCGFGRPVFCLEGRPGFYFIPGALSLEEQCQWMRESLLSFPQPPNRSNHNAIYGPLQDLFAAAKERKVLVKDESDGDRPTWKFVDEAEVPLRGNGCTSYPASALLRKLRWSTLGLQFDWSQRNYDVSLPHNKIPDALCQLAKRLATPAMPRGEEFRPEAAIVNYFASGDTLGGHLDDMEADWSKPIVSLSLGCKAIFLLGGKTRQDNPIAMFLRSGDVVLMAGEARECFHGVPRIFTDKDTAEITPLELHFSRQDDCFLLEYLRSSRININIRQVF